METRLLVTAKEAARLLSISERTLWTLTNAGTIQPVRIGRAVRYAVGELERFIDSQLTEVGGR
jgi:excisionase family DNA binding protein